MKALIVGGARSGKYMALLLNREGYEVILTDNNEVTYKKELEVKNITVIDGGHPDYLLETHYDVIVKNPGIKYSTPFIKAVLAQGYTIYNEIDVALRFASDVDVLAISGTNGKTTTVSLLYAMVKEQFSNVYLGGNIGIAVSELVYKYPNMQTLILELSSFQLDGIYDLKPKIATLLNLQMDHLDYYEDLDAYYNSKQRIYQNQDKNDYYILNQSDQEIVHRFNNDQVQTINLHGIDSVLTENGRDIMFNGELLFSKDDLNIVGQHNVENTMVAALMARLYGVDPLNIQKAIKNFNGVEHRIEFVLEKNNIKFYNDSKATNVESLKVALEAFDQPVILLAGGYDKQISFEDLRAYNSNVKQAYVFGQTKDKLAEVFDHSIVVDTLDDALSFALKDAQADDIILFSPACASFDQFKDYEDRGRYFKQLVKSI
ncbi:MAG: UDP-N-acetylmuramoyl-L-alanine--D-glutamate ligase [Erysipelothrix sp.]|nr:UDP-N-acetylmuramoyl-L-alanine--D-glutamate ligase [Erysipelothrix sp.]